jgi:hypothetical protein
MTEWTYIESSEDNLASLRRKMKLAVEDLDQDALEALSMHFILMKIALTGLRGYAGDCSPDDSMGETPVKIASALADLADHFGFNNTPEHLRSMFEESYASVVCVLIASGHIGEA